MNRTRNVRILPLYLFALTVGLFGCTVEGDERVGDEIHASDGDAVASDPQALQHPEARRVYVEEDPDHCDLSASSAKPCAFFSSSNVPLNPTSDTWFDFALQIGARVSVEITLTESDIRNAQDVYVLLYREEPGGTYLNYKGPYGSRSGFILFDVVEDPFVRAQPWGYGKCRKPVRIITLPPYLQLVSTP